MDIYQEIQERIRRERDNGATQSEISKRTGLGQSHVSRLLDAKRGSEQMKRLGLETFFKLFPNARIVFDDTRQIGDVKNNTNSPVIQGDGNTVGTSGSRESEEEFLRKIMSSEDLDADTKVKIYNIVKGEKL